ncbi:MAG TPA: histidine kinase [Bacteroidota bacterium]|nr:histidine kinase [Bacteroidota bacterium]
MRAPDESTLLNDVCTSICRYGGFQRAWVGYIEGEAPKTIRPVAWAGKGCGEIKSARFPLVDELDEGAPFTTAIRTGRVSIARERSRSSNGINTLQPSTTIALPLRSAEGIFGVLGICACSFDAIRAQEQVWLREIASDLAASIGHLRMRKEGMRTRGRLRESELRYRALVELSPGAILICRSGRIVYSNPAGIELFRLGNVSDPHVKHIAEIFPPNVRHMLLEQMDKALATGKAQPLKEFEVVQGNGELQVLEGVAIPIVDRGKSALQIVMRDVTLHIRATRQLHQYSERLRNLSKQLLTSQENERRHVARELHDEIGQSLTILKLNLQSIRQVGKPADLRRRLEASISIIDSALQKVRSLSLDLRPSILDDLGLIPALEWYLTRQNDLSGTTIQFVHGVIERRPPPEIEIACFRITQEGITNVIRHSGATSAVVELHERPENLHLSIRDNGKGFDVTRARTEATRGKSLGLLGMQERASLVGGQFDIRSKRDVGTDIEVSIPFDTRPLGGKGGVSS